MAAQSHSRKRFRPRLHFLAASESFDSDGEKFTKIVKAQLDRLDDPERATPIRLGAIEAIGEVNSFSRIHADLASRVSTLYLALDVKVLGVQLNLLHGTVAAFELPAGSNPAEAISKQLKQFDAQQLENAAIASSVILMGHRVAEAVRAATQPIEIRQATMAQIAHDLAPDQVGPPEGLPDVAKEGAQAVACQADVQPTSTAAR